MEVLTLPGSSIVTPTDLENKVIGTAQSQEIHTHDAKGQSQPYSIDTVATWSVLTSDNVEVGKIAWDPMPASKLIGALQSHQVSAILATEPTIYQAESQLGAVPVLDACTGATANLPLDGYFTTSSYASRNSQVVAAFAGALAKAQAQAGMAAPLQTAPDHERGPGAPGRRHGHRRHLPHDAVGAEPAAGRQPDVQLRGAAQAIQCAVHRGEAERVLTAPGLPVPGQRIALRPSSRAMIIRWTSEVPSPISSTLASR